MNAEELAERFLRVQLMYDQPAPPPPTEPKRRFNALGVAEGTVKVHLFRAVRRGFKSQVGMPSFRFLSDREVWAVISFLKTLSPRWTSDEVPPPIAT